MADGNSGGVRGLGVLRKRTRGRPFLLMESSQIPQPNIESEDLWISSFIRQVSERREDKNQLNK